MPASSLFHRWFWPLLVVGLALWVAATTFQSGVWLTGWDTLHPEFNFGLHIQRSLSGAWREDQGLGAVAGHSHMSDLPRILLLWIASAIIPLESVKMLYVLACLILGPLGVYYFSCEILSSHQKSKFLVGAAAAVAAIWYLFNLGTVQHFYVVFEMFAVQYAALGWLFLMAVRYLQSGKPRVLALTALIGFLSTPMAYASLLWFSAIGCLAIFLFFLSLISGTPIVSLRRSWQVGLVLFATNAFWLLPNLYFILSGASDSLNQAHINRLFSPEAFLHNQAYGNLSDLALLKNFLFNWSEYQTTGSFAPLLQPWIDHLKKPGILAIGYITFGLSLVGALLGILKKNAKLVALIPVGMTCAIMLINQNPPFTMLFSWLRSQSSLFEEGLRFPFTKFSISYMLTMAAFLGSSVLATLELIKKLPLSKTLISAIQISLISVSVAGLIWFNLPLTQGLLINPKMKTQIPQAYFDFMAWTKTQPNQTRFALLPLETASGWHYFNWNYEGPGFLWFGMSQPLLVRDFDRWSPHNETFYTEAVTALYGRDRTHFSQVLAKYQVSYLMIDQSVIAPGKAQDYPGYDFLPQVLTDIGAKKVWQKDFISVYQIPNNGVGFVQAPAEYSLVDTDPTYGRHDGAFAAVGNYLSQTIVGEVISFPFSFLNQASAIPASYQNGNIVWQIILPESHRYDHMTLPPIATGSAVTSLVALERQADSLLITFGPPIILRLGATEHQLPHLPPVVIPTNQSTASLKVVFNGVTQVIPASGSATFVTNLLANEPIPVQLQELSESVTNGNPLSPRSQNVDIPADIWSDLSRTTYISIPSNARTMTVSVSSQPTTLDLTQIKTVNCQNDQQGEVSAQKEPDGIVYRAENSGVACSGVELPAVNTSQDFLIRFVGKNISGRNLKWYITNNSNKHVDVEELLSGENNDQTFSLLSWTKLTTDTYWLGWETRSFGQPSQNSLSKIELYPLPLSVLSNLRLEPKQSSLRSNSVIVTHNKKIGSHQYVVSANSIANKGLLTLSQSFDHGWVAFAWPMGQKTLMYPLPLEHTIFNGWANAWLVPQGEWRVVILYWPQLLSFAGYSLLLVTAGWFGWQGISSLQRSVQRHKTRSN